MKWEYTLIKGAASPPGDAGAISVMNDAGEMGWEVFAFRPGDKKITLEHGEIQNWFLFCKRPKSAILDPKDEPLPADAPQGRF